jgi:putative tricarboxylic transport membrane protein
MRINDALLGLALLAFALAVGLYARTFPAIPGQQYGAAVFPTWIAIGLGAAALVLIVGGVRRWRDTGAVDLAPWARSARHLWALALTIGLLLFSILAWNSFGFIPTMFVVLTALLIAMEVWPWQAPILALVIILAVHHAFYRLLLVPLPWGVLEPWAW